MTLLSPSLVDLLLAFELRAASDCGTDSIVFGTHAYAAT